jgi:hypothetical protein
MLFRELEGKSPQAAVAAKEVTHRTWQRRGRLHLIPESKHQED